MTLHVALASMTGYARATGAAAGAHFACKVRSVNGRGLDIRTRLPPGFDALEVELRRLASTRLTRGSVTVSVSVERDTAGGEVFLNRQALETVLEALRELEGKVDARKPSLDGILALRGVLDQREAPLDPVAEEALNAAVLAAAARAFDALSAARREEGERIGAVLAARIGEIEALVARAETHPARSREAVQARLRQQLALLGGEASGIGEERLAQEALLLATKADIREELDRLTAHVASARDLLAGGGPVGRKLDFLAQEFNREANTLCSKSNAVELTAIGLDLKAAIDQLREQVQNIE
jgi:uncharacterized protein (TIGR00255 family)